MKRTTGWIGVAGIAAIVVVIGVWVWNPWSGSPTSSDGPTAASSSDGSDVEVGPNVGQRAPAFTLSALDGSEVSLADYEGQPVILEFWASWCPNCNATAPHLEEFARRHEDVAVVGINMGVNETDEQIQSFVDEHGIGFPVALDDGSVTETYRVTKTSTYVFIDAQGIIREIKAGVKLDLSDFETAYTNTLNSEG